MFGDDPCECCSMFHVILIFYSLHFSALVDIPLDSQDTLPNTPLQDEGYEDNSLETNCLLESIAKTLGLNSQHNFYAEDSFPSCSIQVTKEYHKVSKFHQNDESHENFKQAGSFHENECDLTNIIQENDSFLNNLEQESSVFETDDNPLKEGEPFFERVAVYWENKFIMRTPFFHDMIKDNINMESETTDKAILQKKLPDLTSTDSDESALARSSEPNQTPPQSTLSDEGSSEILDESQTVWSST